MPPGCPAAQQALLAAQLLAAVRERAQAAAAARRLPVKPAVANDRAAALHDRLAASGHGDADKHRRAAEADHS
jgi:hypothetical protein